MIQYKKGGRQASLPRGYNQYDWAVLCLRNRASSILIYPAESTNNVLEIDKRADLAADWSNFKGGNFEYGRMITSAGRKSILYYYKEFAEPQGEPKPPPIDHEGIEDHYLGKASTIHYYYRGKWLQLQGAD